MELELREIKEWATEPAQVLSNNSITLQFHGKKGVIPITWSRILIWLILNITKSTPSAVIHSLQKGIYLFNYVTSISVEW